MARQDISYDFEDFDMSPDQLRDKYIDAGEHPEFTTAKYEEAVAEGAASGYYWEWVQMNINLDDENFKGEPDSATYENAPLPPPPAIETLDQFAAVVARWHMHGMKQAEHMLEMPEGYVTHYIAKEGDAPVEIELKGDLLVAFRMGVMTGVDAFGSLPFTYSLDEAAVEPEQDNGTTQSV